MMKEKKNLKITPRPTVKNFREKKTLRGVIRDGELADSLGCVGE